MPSVNEIILELKKIQNSIDSIEIKGVENASMLLYAYNTCRNLIGTFENALEKALKPSEEVTENGSIPDSNTITADT